MPTINWDTATTTITAAIITAAVTTLVVEYAAKPRLEARKERILGNIRARRDFLAAIVNLSLAAQFVLLEMPKDATPQELESFRAEWRRQADKMRRQADEMFDNAGKYGRLYGGPVRDLVIRYVTCIKGTVISLRTQRGQAQIIKDLAIPIVTVLDGPRWRVIARVRAFFEVGRLIDRNEERDDDTAQLRRIPVRS